jgi:hypothetical protein
LLDAPIAGADGIDAGHYWVTRASRKPEASRDDK